jgi:hypothetical protein
MKTAIVTTTINVPIFLEGYLVNFRKFKINPEKAMFIIIGDMKSDHDKIKKYIEGLNSEYIIEYWDVDKQKEWILQNYPGMDVDSIIPWNSIRRRNLGYLRALELKKEIIITIDDDNFVAEDVDWFNQHIESFYGNKKIMKVHSLNKIVNPCDMLSMNTQNIYSRGYPITKMFSNTFEPIFPERNKVVLNVGLWRESPDIDGIANLLYNDIKSYGIKMDMKDKYALFMGNYIPINTQNTSFLAEITPAFYALLMDTEINGLKMDRYDDVWAGWFITAIAHHLGDTVTFGTPLTNHIRNKHDYLKDTKSEFLAMILNLELFNFVQNLNLLNSNYFHCYEEISSELIRFAYSLDESLMPYFERLSNAMKGWLLLCKKWM